MKNNKLISEIRSVLLNDWDPIGVGNNPNLSDEYDGYIGSIIQILMKNPSVEIIVIFLKKTEEEIMGADCTDVLSLYDVAVRLKKVANTYLKEKQKN